MLDVRMEDKPRLDPFQAVHEAQRCFYCYDPSCVRHCATSIDIPTFIRKIATGNVKGAAKTILEANILGYSCGKVCPTEVMCEGACVWLERGGPAVLIGALQAYAVGKALEENWRFFSPGPASGKRVAVVGAGPAGLACAHELRRLGHEVTLFERREILGGLNTTGIAPYKLSVEESLQEVEYVLQMGVEVRRGVSLGREVRLHQLRREYDALFLGLGLGGERALSLDGRDLEGNYSALEAIEAIRLGEKNPFSHLGHAIVVGGGNTAIDVARNLVRSGVEEVWVFYRRSEEQMKAYEHEVAAARREGVLFRFHLQPLRVEGADGKVRALRCQTPEGEKVFPTEAVFWAVGQALPSELREELAPMLSEQGTVVVDENYQTALSGVFAGGDCVNGGREVVHAVRDGREAARAIDRFLKQR